MYIYSDTVANLLMVESSISGGVCRIFDKSGAEVECPQLKSEVRGDTVRRTLDAGGLELWSPGNPVLYTMELNGEKAVFGHSTIRPFQNKYVLLNGSPVYLRGYIRGIIAHDHPNMTGGTLRDAAIKNISQAKKYGFNLVRFHSTIPTDEFVEAADELGLLIHLEIGFAYDYDEAGNKKNLSMSNAAWHDTIVRLRNHPSVAIFCIGNEMHNSGHFPEVRRMYDEGRALAPNKMIMDNSGWGEYDRSTADIYSQHIAYFFPYKHHAGMFAEDNPWRMNGSVSDAPLEGVTETGNCRTAARRTCTPIRPVISHEALHYVDVPDYEALSRKFDDFAAKVGPEYIKTNGIKKPRFMTELPELIRKKNLTAKYPDYITGSRLFKKTAYKVFLEKLRLSNLTGYEMLQFSDCLKYENKNGIVDCFDDDKYIDPEWLMQFNGDLVLLAEFEDECFYFGDTVKAAVSVSDFLPSPEIQGDLKVTFGGKEIYSGKNFVLAGGLQKLVDLTISTTDEKEPVMRELAVAFTSGDKTYTNSWKLWFYPRVKPLTRPEACLNNAKLNAWLDGTNSADNVFLTDALSDKVFDKLNDGATVVLLYSNDAAENTWKLPGALERFKPCIWDRGSNLGGIFGNKKLAEKLASCGYFDLNMQPLLEAGYKINLDKFPCKVAEHVSGIDKPVRDRMKGLIQGIKDFIPEDTLRNFSHLFSFKVGKGTLIVSTFNVENPESPVVANYLTALLDDTQSFCGGESMTCEAFKQWLEEVNTAGFQPEDVMNHFWEIDNKPVEDTLFWEQAGIDLSSLKE